MNNFRVESIYHHVIFFRNEIWLEIIIACQKFAYLMTDYIELILTKQF